MGVNQSSDGADPTSPGTPGTPGARRSSDGVAEARRNSDGADAARRALKPQTAAARGEASHFSSLSHEKMAELIKKDSVKARGRRLSGAVMEEDEEEEDEEEEDSFPAAPQMDPELQNALASTDIPPAFPLFAPKVSNTVWKLSSNAGVQDIPVMVMEGYALPISGLAAHPRSKEVAVTCRTGEATVISTATGEAVPLGNRLSRLPYTDVSFSTDGRFIATASVDKALRLWDARTRTEIASSMAHDSSVTCVQFAQHSSNLLASGGGDKPLVRVWEIKEEGAEVVLGELTVLAGHWAYVTALAFSPDGNCLASACMDGTVRLWDIAGGEPLADMGFGSSNAVQDRTKLYVQGMTHISHRQLEDEIVSDGAEQRFKWARPDMDRERHLCKLLDSDGWGRQKETRYQYVDCSDGQIVYTSSGWLRTLKGHSGPVNGVAFSADARRLASVGDDGTVRVWDAQAYSNAELVLDDRFCEGTAGFHVLSIEDEMRPSGADAQAMVIEADEEVRLRIRFDPRGQFVRHGSGPRPRNLKRMERPGASFADRMRNPVYQLVKEESGEVLFDWDSSLKTLEGHTAPVTSVLFIATDSYKAVTCSDDGTARVWDLEAGTCLSTLSGPALPPLCCMLVAPSPPTLCLGDRAGALHILRGEVVEKHLESL